jgi:hypothetical protein
MMWRFFFVGIVLGGALRIAAPSHVGQHATDLTATASAKSVGDTVASFVQR